MRHPSMPKLEYIGVKSNNLSLIHLWGGGVGWGDSEASLSLGTSPSGVLILSLPGPNSFACGAALGPAMWGIL